MCPLAQLSLRGPSCALIIIVLAAWGRFVVSPSMSITRLWALVQFSLGLHPSPLSRAGLSGPVSHAISVGATFAAPGLSAMSFITIFNALASVP